MPIFHLHFSLVWIGSCSTLVLCTALLAGRLSLSDVLELAILKALLTVTVLLQAVATACRETAQSQLTVIQVPHHGEFASLRQYY